MTERVITLVIPCPDGRPDLVRTVKPSYIYCNVCGRTPGADEEPNYGPIGWWDPDDGYKLGTLCREHIMERVPTQPDPSDYAYKEDGSFSIDDSGTDEDPIWALEEMFC